MIPLRAPLQLLAAALLLVGCNEEITDTEQRTFRIDCGKRETCALLLRDAVSDGPDDASDTDKHDHLGSREPQSPEFTLNAETRILRVCPNPGAEAAACRALACESSSPCSRLGGPQFTCISGLCQATAREIESADRVALCLAGTGAWERSRPQLERYTLARGCRPPCEVPAACRQP